MAQNPFELKARNDGPEIEHVSKVWTDEEQAEKLSGYLEVQPEFWAQIKYGIHLRYFTKAEGYRPGGFVLRNPFDITPKGSADEKRFIKLQNGFNDKLRGYAQWIVAYEDISKIYIKPDASSLVIINMLETSVKSLNENIRKIAEYCKKFETRITALEASIKTRTH